MKIIHNNQYRNVIGWHELTKKEQAEFDYIDNPEEDATDFVRFKGQVYDLSQTMCTPEQSELADFDAYISDSFFSGIAFKFDLNNCDTRVLCATYYS